MHNKFFTTLDEKLKISINDNNELEISINDNNKYKLDLIKQLKYIKINSINNLKDYKDKVIDYKTINDNTIDYTYSKLLLKCLVIDSFQYKKRECQYLIFNGIFDNILNNILERRSFLLS